MLSNIRAINKHFIEKSTSYCLNHTPNASIYFFLSFWLILSKMLNLCLSTSMYYPQMWPLKYHLALVMCSCLLSLLSSLGCCELYHHQFLCLTFFGVPFDFSGLLSYFPCEKFYGTSLRDPGLHGIWYIAPITDGLISSLTLSSMSE